MKAKLTPTRSFNVIVGDVDLDSFTIESCWGGFTKLVDADGEFLIVTGLDDGGFAAAFAPILDPKALLEVEVVSCSAHLARRLQS